MASKYPVGVMGRFRRADGSEYCAPMAGCCSAAPAGPFEACCPGTPMPPVLQADFSAVTGSQPVPARWEGVRLYLSLTLPEDADDPPGPFYSVLTAADPARPGTGFGGDNPDMGFQLVCGGPHTGGWEVYRAGDVTAGGHFPGVGNWWFQSYTNAPSVVCGVPPHYDDFALAFTVFFPFVAALDPDWTALVTITMPPAGHPLRLRPAPARPARRRRAGLLPEGYSPGLAQEYRRPDGSTYCESVPTNPPDAGAPTPEMTLAGRFRRPDGGEYFAPLDPACCGLCGCPLPPTLWAKIYLPTQATYPGGGPPVAVVPGANNDFPGEPGSVAAATQAVGQGVDPPAFPLRQADALTWLGTVAGWGGVNYALKAWCANAGGRPAWTGVLTATAPGGAATAYDYTRPRPFGPGPAGAAAPFAPAGRGGCECNGIQPAGGALPGPSTGFTTTTPVVHFALDPNDFACLYCCREQPLRITITPTAVYDGAGVALDWGFWSPHFPPTVLSYGAFRYEIDDSTSPPTYSTVWGWTTPDAMLVSPGDTHWLVACDSATGLMRAGAYYIQNSAPAGRTMPGLETPVYGWETAPSLKSCRPYYARGRVVLPRLLASVSSVDFVAQE